MVSRTFNWRQESTTWKRLISAKKRIYWARTIEPTFERNSDFYYDFCVVFRETFVQCSFKFITDNLMIV